MMPGQCVYYTLVHVHLNLSCLIFQRDLMQTQNNQDIASLSNTPCAWRLPVSAP